MQSSYTVIKKSMLFFAVFAVMVSVLFSFGCSVREHGGKAFKVSLVDSIFFTAETPSGEVEYGDNFTTAISLRAGYEFASCDYEDYSASRDGQGNIILTFRNIVRPSRITVKTRKIIESVPEFQFNCTVDYDFNGGISGADNSVYAVDYTLTKHLRPNTWNGIGLEKSGYTLYGWNTERDGSGEHIGLGSRVTVPYGGKITLYAEWLKQIEESDFLFAKLPDGTCALTGYRGRGDVQPFVIPSKIRGADITEIASSFTVNMPCKSITSSTLVLPDTLKSIKGNAFLNSGFSELCFSDNIEKIEENAFPYNFKTYRINARRAPCFQDKNNSTLFSDNMDRLILNSKRRKLILFSGCSFAYGVNSPAVDEALNGDYVVMNMGMNGDINGAFQMEILINYITDGDIFIHAPEQMSPSQLMYSFFTNSTMFVMTEGNYDLLTQADFSDNGGVMRAFFDYIQIKNETDECSYSDGSNGDFNIYGDYIFERPYDEQTESERDVTYSDNVYCYEPSFLTPTSVDKLASYYDKIEERGGKVMLSYAPVNISARQEGEIREKGLEFAKKFESMLGGYGYKCISDVEDYMFTGRYFFDSDYHLNDLGAALRTEQLLKDLFKEGI